jgi:transcriptional regulator with XRE-family HTH domain
MVSRETIRRVRTALGESQAQFGARFGVDQSAVARWETKGLPERGTARIAVSQFIEGLPAESAEAAQ